MRNISKALLCFLILKNLVFSIPEEAYIEIQAKSTKNSFYRVLIDGETEEIYLGVSSLIDFFRIEDLKFDRKRFKVSGNLDKEKEINRDIPRDKIIEEEDDVYIPLEEIKKLFEIGSSNWDEERFVLFLYPDFKTPHEYRAELNQQRSLLGMAKREKMMEEEEDYFQVENSLITPGILKLTYSNSDFTENDYSLGLNYGTQLLYGEFEISQDIYPESELNYARLKYRDILGKNNLIFGDFYLESDSTFDIDKSLRGISLSKNEYYGYQEENRTIIQGEALDASVVELYRNGILEDFELLTDRNSFRFNVLNVSSMDRYTIKIYYRDGRVETKDIYIIGNQNILNKGESDYVLQIGESIDEKKMQYLGKYSYGVTPNLTLGTGISFLENDEGEKYEVFEGSFAYRTRAERYPTLFSGTILEEISTNELNFKGIVQQRLGQSTNLSFRYEVYGNQTAERIQKKNLYNIELSKGFRRVSGSLGFLKNIYEDDNINQVYLNMDYSATNNLRMSLSNEYYKSKNDGDNVQGFGSEIKFNYSGFKEVYAILGGRVNYEENAAVDNEINLSLVRRAQMNSYLPNLDARFEIGYSEDRGTFFQLNLTYIFDGNIYIEFPDIRKDQDKTTVGARVEKSIYLGNPLLKINNNDVKNGWVEGKVFIDENGNGIMDRGEEILEGAEVTTSGGEFITDKNGKYIIGNISPNDLHKIEINNKTIDPMLGQGKEMIKFKGSHSSGVKVDIPVVPLSVISGYIEADEEVSEKNYLGVLGNADVVLKKNNIEIGRAQTEMDGYYYFENILPGEYVIELETTSKRYKAEIDKERIYIKVKTGREGDYYDDNNLKILKVNIAD